MRFRFVHELLQAKHPVVHRRLGRGRVHLLPEGSEAKLGVFPTYLAEGPQRGRQTGEPDGLLGTVYELELGHGSAGGARLVGHLGVDAAVDVVLHGLLCLRHPDHARHPPGAHGNQQRDDVLEALDVDGKGTAAAVEARRHAQRPHDGDQALRKLLPRHGDLQVEVPAWVRDEAASHEGAAHEGAARGAAAQKTRGHARSQAVARREDAQLKEGVCQLVLLGHLYEIVPGLVQDAPAHGEGRVQVKELVRHLDDGARDGARLGGYADGVAAAAPEGERAADPHEGGELRQLRALVAVLKAGELVFDLGGKRHASSSSR